MPTQAEVARYLQGALLLAKGDASGIRLFDLSIEGFWQSFTAALIAAPAYLLVLIDRFNLTGWPENLLGSLTAETIAYGCSWVAFPIAAIFLTRVLGLGGRYVPLVVAANWSAVLQIGLYTAVVLTSLILPQDLRAVLVLAATIAVLIYQWFVIRSALETSSGIAFGLLIVDALLSMTVSRTVDALLQPG
jgi:hypothetical protein